MLETLGGFNPKFPICNDLDFWLRAVQSNFRFVGVAEPTCNYRKHPGAMSMKSAELIAECGRVQQQFIRWTSLPRGLRIKSPACRLLDAARILRRNHPVKAGALATEAAIAFIKCFWSATKAG
jgi:hypothetical protein